MILLFCIICFITLDSKYTQLATNQGAKLSAVDLPKDYIYLPAIFIYKDIKRLEWLPNIQEKYEIGESKNIYYHDKSNLKLLRGSSGTALALLPAFIVAHMVCNITDYEQDGYSLPYQISVHYWKIFLVILSLFLSWHALAKYYEQSIALVTVLVFMMCTQIVDVVTSKEYFAYVLLFTSSAILYIIDRFWQKPGIINATLLGGAIGLSILIDLNNIIFIILLILWKITPKVYHIKSKGIHLLVNFKYYILILFLCGIFLALHLCYTYHLLESAEFYNYDGRIFGYLWYNLYNAVFSIGFGWLVYTPICILSMIGFISLWRDQKRIFYTFILFSILYLVVYNLSNVSSFSLEIGNTYMVGLYPILMFPLASLLDQTLQSRKILFVSLMLLVFLAAYYNFWLLYNKKQGTFISSKEMSKEYFYHVLGKENLSPQTIKLLDTEIIYEGSITDSIVLIQDKYQYCLDKKTQYTLRWEALRTNTSHKQVRFILDAKTETNEADVWHYAQMLISMYSYDINLKNEMIRVQRFTKKNEWTTVWIDAMIPDATTKLVGSVWNAENNERICFKNIKIFTYKVNNERSKIKLKTNQ